MDIKRISHFKSIVANFYTLNRRSFPWRDTHNPYHILISEFMLQQTQTHRVVDKYLLFVEAFPKPYDLAAAPFSSVLEFWQGLGYNRRALFLHNAVKSIVSEFNGIVPNNLNDLTSLPGIGPYTASAVCTFAYNQPLVFIETNIRTVFIHHFFTDNNDVNDKELMPYIEQTLDTTNPREWYYALMDYGVYVKATYGNKNKQSKHYTKQSKFEGSDRQIRGEILRILIKNTNVSIDQVRGYFAQKDRLRIDKIIAQLMDQKMIRIEQDSISIF